MFKQYNSCLGVKSQSYYIIACMYSQSSKSKSYLNSLLHSYYLNYNIHHNGSKLHNPIYQIANNQSIFNIRKPTQSMVYK